MNEFSDPVGDDHFTGLYTKYQVERLHDTKGKHKNCYFFVLDTTHDVYAKEALTTYARACEVEYPQLAEDLWDLIETL